MRRGNMTQTANSNYEQSRNGELNAMPCEWNWLGRVTMKGKIHQSDIFIIILRERDTLCEWDTRARARSSFLSCLCVNVNPSLYNYYIIKERAKTRDPRR